MSVPVPTPLFRDVKRGFDRVAQDFDGADFVHRATFDGLLERLAPLLIEPSRILDLGCATGLGSLKLARHYRKSTVVGLDASRGMLRQATARRSFTFKPALLEADARNIPLADHSIDLVFANLLLPWIDDLASCLAEVARVLRKGGVFAFASFGPDSLAELRDAWQSVDDEAHVAEFADMHDIGDAIVRAGLRDPVLDVDYLNVTYKEPAALYRDLTACGARNRLRERRRSLTGKDRFSAMEKQLAKRMTDNVLSLKLELVFGHAWGGGDGSGQRAGEVRIDPRSITKRRIER
ncbi:MAG: methyltransferase domain-containing protein [Woeseiaceae bacterium]|nr:methyltransferase domain-containing protein [Woeseiaceae bacterium]